MRTGTKIGLAGLGFSIVSTLVFGFIEVYDYRKGKRRMHQEDIKLIAESVVREQERVKLEKKKTAKAVIKSEELKG